MSSNIQDIKDHLEISFKRLPSIEDSQQQQKQQSGHDKNEIQWSSTPIDIVGNFEQEVEHELGLMVSGYKSSSSSDDSLSTTILSMPEVNTCDKGDSISQAQMDKSMKKVSKLLIACCC